MRGFFGLIFFLGLTAWIFLAPFFTVQWIATGEHGGEVALWVQWLAALGGVLMWAFIINTIKSRRAGNALAVDLGRPRRQPIPAHVRQAVWERDGGRCVDCGATEDLEYDHVIPVVRGGANTAANIDLRCQFHNRSKGARI
jgi:HNH endonuclease